MGLQHDIPHERFQGHGGIGLFRCWSERAVWDVLYANPDLSDGSGRGEDEIDSASLDGVMHRSVHHARRVLEMVRMGLHI